jgi:hypothetical protein
VLGRDVGQPLGFALNLDVELRAQVSEDGLEVGVVGVLVA